MIFTALVLLESVLAEKPDASQLVQFNCEGHPRSGFTL